MLFWGMHCQGKFDVATISYAVDRASADVAAELKSLVETGVVDVCSEQGVPLYSLTKNLDKRRAIIQRAGPRPSGA
jgi:hypothetical protein